MIEQAINAALQHLQLPHAWLELFACACGIFGSLLLALNGPRAGWGWVLFAFSNVGWIVFAHGHGHLFLMLVQLVFSMTSAVGIWKYLINPAPAMQATPCAPAITLAWRIQEGDNSRITYNPMASRAWLQQGFDVEALTFQEGAVQWVSVNEGQAA